MLKTRILFVCMGNICRSPTAQGVFESVVDRAGLADVIEVDSAGTHAYHIGEPPDHRAQTAAARRGIDLSAQRARRVEMSDFSEYDYVLAMDKDNLDDLQALCPTQHRDKVHLFMGFAAGHPESAVPDPYYGGANGFEKVLDMVETAANGLLAAIKSR